MDDSASFIVCQNNEILELREADKRKFSFRFHSSSCVLRNMLQFTCDFEYLRRPGNVLWTFVFVFYLVDQRSRLPDPDNCNIIFTAATFKGLGYATMTSDKVCCVPNCGSEKEILHKFPNPDKDPDRFRSWLYSVGGDILQMQNDMIFKYRRVCHLHFETCYHTRSKFLSANAIPTLNLSGRPTRRQPLIDVTNERTPSTSENVSTSPIGQSPNVLPPQPSEPAPIVPGSKLQQNQKLVKLKKTVKSFETEKRSLANQMVKLKKKNDSYLRRLKKAQKLATNMSFQNALKKFKTLAAIFTVMQFREITKPKMGRRFTKEEKIMALSVYKAGPKAYRWLSKIFVLPSPVTLSRMVSRANLKPGINENIFEQLKKRCAKMKSDDKLCTLIFDEMALSPHFDFNRKKDRITGFVNYNGEASGKIADHVLVYMIRGITKNYKQPIYYSFCSGSTPKEVLATQIKEIIRKLHSIGFTVLATVCDQGATNTSAINYLIEETRMEYLRKNETFRYNTLFEIDGKQIIPLFDVPHLLKGMRNNLLVKNLKFSIDGEEKVAKWEHITQLYENNPTYKGLKIIKNLTENHCNKDKIPKMKVKYASQLFSQTVGKTMGYLAENGILPKETRDTADFIIFIDNLFDSLNGSFNNSNIRSGKELLRNVTPNSCHKETWIQAKSVLQSMKFITAGGTTASVPSIKNWIRTIENMEILRDKLFCDYNIKSFWCRHFNQDPLENFFGSIRSHGLRNTSPSSAAFEAAFASLLVNNMSSNYSPGSNCEEDFCTMFESFDELFFSKNIYLNPISEVDFEDTDENVIIDFEAKKKDPRVIAQLEYVTGYILRKAKKIVKNCIKCKNSLYTRDPGANKYLNFREYCKGQRYLTYPSQNLIKCFSEIQDTLHHILKNKSHIRNLKEYMKTVLYININTDFVQCSHKTELIEFMYEFSCRFFANNWCRLTNKLLDGSSVDVDQNDKIQNQALVYCTKRQRNRKQNKNAL